LLPPLPHLPTDPPIPASRTRRRALHIPAACVHPGAGTVKLADFGVSAELSATEQKAETVCGTPFYLSPEMVNGKPYTAATDVWSLGCILWELLTLQRPFSGSNIMQLAMQIMSKQLDEASLEALAVDADRKLVAMVVSMLSKDPAARPSVQQLHDDPFLSERLGHLYLRQAGPLGERGSGGSYNNSRPQSGRARGQGSRPSTPSSSALAATLRAAASTPPPSAEAQAATRLQAVARGRRDRKVASFFKSISSSASRGASQAARGDERRPPRPREAQALPSGAPPHAGLHALPAPKGSRSAQRSAVLGKPSLTLESLAPLRLRMPRASETPTSHVSTPTAAAPCAAGSPAAAATAHSSAVAERVLATTHAMTPPDGSRQRRPVLDNPAAASARLHSAQVRRTTPVGTVDSPWYTGNAAPTAGVGVRSRPKTPASKLELRQWAASVDGDSSSPASGSPRPSLRAPLGSPRADEQSTSSARLVRPHTASGLSGNMRLRNELLLAADGSARSRASPGEAGRTSVRLQPDWSTAGLELGAHARPPGSPGSPLRSDLEPERGTTTSVHCLRAKGAKLVVTPSSTAASGKWTQWRPLSSEQ
jgi:hypothetical protein